MKREKKLIIVATVLLLGALIAAWRARDLSAEDIGTRMTNSQAQADEVPLILSARFEGKKLIVTGAHFDETSRILIDSRPVKTKHDLSQNDTVLVWKKARKHLTGDQVITIQVRNLVGPISEPFSFYTGAKRTLYLAPPSLGGSDSHSCTQSQNVETPKATIAAALACMNGGDILEIRGGTYEMPPNAITPPSGTNWSNATVIKNYKGETVTFVKSANNDPVVFLNSERSYIIFEGSAPDKLVFDAAHFNYNAIKITSPRDGVAPPNHIRFKNCEIKNAVNSGALSSHRYTPNEGSIEFISCHIHHNGTRDNLDHGTYMNVPNVLVEYCDVHDNAAYGIQWDNGPSDNAICRFNRVHNNGVVGGGGIVIYGLDARNHQVYNNVVYDNGGGYGIIIRTKEAIVCNNTFYDANSNGGGIYLWGERHGIIRNNIARFIFLDNSPNTTIENNAIIGDKIVIAGAGSTETKQSQNLFGIWDPLFVDAAAHDFHLQSDSPAKDRGVDALNILDTDFDGNPRPQGPAFDIGAFEVVQK